MSSLRLTIQIPEGSLRVDKLILEAVRAKFPETSRQMLKDYFSNAKITAYGKPLHPSSALPPGSYEVEIQDWVNAQQTRTAQPSIHGVFLPIVYEDNDLLVLHKYSGVPSIPHSTEETETAVGSALARSPELSDIGHGGLEPGILHRLDTGTSGLIAFAKTQEEWERLHQAWQRREVIKIYRAICAGSDQPLPKLPAQIRLHIGHDPKSAKRMIGYDPKHPRKIRGKPLSTLTELLTAHSIQASQADLQIRIETGVMHQIRCTLAHLGWPILGDSIYHGPEAARLFLHAWRLEIPLRSRQTLALEANLPENWPVF